MSKSIPSLRYAVLIAFLGAALTACTGASPQVVYYSLLETDAAAAAAPRHDQLVLSVGPIKQTRRRGGPPSATNSASIIAGRARSTGNSPAPWLNGSPAGLGPNRCICIPAISALSQPFKSRWTCLP